MHTGKPSSRVTPCAAPHFGQVSPDRAAFRASGPRLSPSGAVDGLLKILRSTSWNSLAQNGVGSGYQVLFRAGRRERAAKARGRLRELRGRHADDGQLDRSRVEELRIRCRRGPAGTDGRILRREPEKPCVQVQVRADSISPEALPVSMRRKGAISTTIGAGNKARWFRSSASRGHQHK